jgi:hypothetical protein
MDPDVQSNTNVSMAVTSSPSGSLASTGSTHKRKTSKIECTEPPIKKTKKIASFGAPQETDRKLTASTATVRPAAGTALLEHSQAIAAMSMATAMSTEETSATTATDEAPSEGYEAQSVVNMGLKARFLTKSDPQPGDAAVTNAVTAGMMSAGQNYSRAPIVHSTTSTTTIGAQDRPISTLSFATISDDELNVPTVPVAANESFHAHMVDGIEKQKQRAINLLNECNLHSQYPATKLAEVENLKEDILNDLEMGLVPPTYHALVRGYDPFGSRTPVPSGKSVKAGENIEDGNPCPHFDRYEENFFDTFVTNDKAYKQVRDEDLHPYIWKYNATAATSIERLDNNKAKMVGEDLEITENLLSVFDIQTSKSVSKTLLTRCESRGVVANCFCADEPSLSLAITGSPGIGKSWTLLYVLQQALLYENACVLFFNQKVKEALLCIRKGDMVCAWMCSTHNRAFSSLFPRENVLVLLDGWGRFLQWFPQTHLCRIQ